GDDLGGVPRLTVLVLPGAILEAAFDVELIALLAVLLDDIRQPGPTAPVVVPRDDAMPFGLLLLVPALARPLPAGSKTEVGDAPPVGGAADFRILSQVADQDDLVEAATHGGPPLQGYRNEHGGALPPDSTNARAGDPTRIALKMTKSTLRHGRRQCLP